MMPMLRNIILESKHHFYKNICLLSTGSVPKEMTCLTTDTSVNAQIKR
jgi:hypothetical protein